MTVIQNINWHPFCYPKKKQIRTPQLILHFLFMKYQLSLLFTLTLASFKGLAQTDPYRSKGFYNITKISTGLFTKASEQNQLGPYGHYNNPHLIAMHSSLGLHIGNIGLNQLGFEPVGYSRRSAVMGLEGGIGIIKYFNPNLTVLPYSLGLKIFFSQIDNSLYLAAGGHGSITKKGIFKDALGFNIGAGYKFFLFDGKCFIVELIYEERFINLLNHRAVTQSEHSFDINHLTLSIGIMPF